MAASKRLSLIGSLLEGLEKLMELREDVKFERELIHQIGRLSGHPAAENPIFLKIRRVYEEFVSMLEVNPARGSFWFTEALRRILKDEKEEENVNGDQGDGFSLKNTSLSEKKSGVELGQVGAGIRETNKNPSRSTEPVVKKREEVVQTSCVFPSNGVTNFGGVEEEGEQKSGQELPAQSSYYQAEKWNFCLNERELKDCEEGKKFWCGEKNKEAHKYFIRLEQPSYPQSKENLYFLSEKIGDGEISTFRLTIEEITARITGGKSNKRIWIHNLFKFEAPILGEYPETKEFFSLIKPFITHLSMDHSEQWSYSPSLIAQLPNLEYLAVSNDLEHDWDGATEESQIFSKLTTVRFITYYHSLELIEMILKASPVLENIFNLPASWIPLAQKYGKVQAIKGLDTGSCQVEDSDLLKKSMSSLETEVEEFNLDFGTDGEKTCPVVQSIQEHLLEMNKDHIRKLQLSYPNRGADIEFLQIPRLEKVEVLDFTWIPKSSGVFPDNFDLNNKFPHVSQVTINFGGCDKVEVVFPPHIFIPGVSLPAVHRLHLIGCPPECLNGLGLIFPRIKILSLTPQSVSSSAGSLSKTFELWPGLEQLHLEIEADRESSRSGNVLDSAFTGFSQELLAVLKNERCPPEFLQLRGKPSISNLKRLKLFQIFYSENCDTPNCLMSEVSALHGFNKELMPDLEIIIGFSPQLTLASIKGIKEGLESLKAHANLKIEG